MQNRKKPPVNLDEYIQGEKRKYITYEAGARLYSMPYWTFVKVAKEDKEMAQFCHVPKALYTGEYFRGISFEAKAIYVIIIDRVSLSIKMGGWMKMVKLTYTITGGI